MPLSGPEQDKRFDELRDAIKDVVAKAETAAAEAVKVRTEMTATMDAIASNVAKLASARLIQQAFTSLVLAGALSIFVHVLSS